MKIKKGKIIELTPKVARWDLKEGREVYLEQVDHKQAVKVVKVLKPVPLQNDNQIHVQFPDGTRVILDWAQFFIKLLPLIDILIYWIGAKIEIIRKKRAEKRKKNAEKRT